MVYLRHSHHPHYPISNPYTWLFRAKNDFKNLEALREHEPLPRLLTSETRISRTEPGSNAYHDLDCHSNSIQCSLGHAPRLQKHFTEKVKFEKFRDLDCKVNGHRNLILWHFGHDPFLQKLHRNPPITFWNFQQPPDWKTNIQTNRQTNSPNKSQRRTFYVLRTTFYVRTAIYCASMIWTKDRKCADLCSLSLPWFLWTFVSIW